MKRVQTVEDLSREEASAVKRRCKPGLLDPLDDPSIPMAEKRRLSSLWEVIQTNRQNQARLHELLGPFLQKPQSVSAAPSDRTPLPIQSGLQIACLFGDLNLVKMLVSRGEKIDQVTMSPDNFGRGRCPMSVAAELGHHHILQFLITSGGDAKNIHDPPLRQAVRKKDLGAMKLLVAGGADPDPTLHQHLWPKCDVDVARMLLEAGAHSTGTMLLTALWRGCGAKLIKLLLQFGAPFVSDMENESALQVSITRGASREVVHALVYASPKWTRERHHMYPRAFRDRVRTLALVNARQSRSLPDEVVACVTMWLAVAEKRLRDTLDLKRAVCSALDSTSLERRLEQMGFKPRGSSHAPSKMAALQSLNWIQLEKVLLQKARNGTLVKLQHAGGKSRSRMSHSDSTLDADGEARVYPSERKRAKSSSSNNRRLQHPVADSRNPNSPKPHHCTCCHVCHVSMKQRPRPIAACSQCNTIICKLCLMDRWKTDQWEEACSTSNWICHKCRGLCVCKSCKSKGSRAAANAAKYHN